MSSCQLFSSNFSFMFPMQQKLFFRVSMAAIQVPESVFGLMITVCFIYLKTYQSPKYCMLLICLNHVPAAHKFEDDDWTLIEPRVFKKRVT